MFCSARLITSADNTVLGAVHQTPPPRAGTNAPSQPLTTLSPLGTKNLCRMARKKGKTISLAKLRRLIGVHTRHMRGLRKERGHHSSRPEIIYIKKCAVCSTTQRKAESP